MDVQHQPEEEPQFYWINNVKVKPKERDNSFLATN